MVRVMVEQKHQYLVLKPLCCNHIYLILHGPAGDHDSMAPGLYLLAFGHNSKILLALLCGDNITNVVF